MKGVHPSESNTQSGSMPKNYQVVLELEVMAKTPDQAATIARDIMLDPDSEFAVDVHKIVWCEEAWDSFPDHDTGTQCRFGGIYHEHFPNNPGDPPGALRVRVTRKYSVRPTDSVGWKKAE
jgi:hypothetical protein